MEKMASARPLRGPDCDAPLPDDIEIGRPSAIRSRIASEIGAAMAHELNGPMTALMLYVGDLHQNRERIAALDGGDQLKRVVDSAFREAERVCSLIHRMCNYFESPIANEAAIAVARDAITWWSRSGNADRSIDAGNRLAEDSRRPGVKALTPREREVLRLVSEGCSNKEGAKQMSISYRTFECHRAEVMRKLGAKNAADLVRLALMDMAGSGATAELRDT
jgi:DNA-binding NarL/FixJ family response regulator